MAQCSSCGSGFTCGLSETSEPCWCAALPVLARIDPSRGCLCPTCLAALLKTQQSWPAEPAGAQSDA
jgi:hypothetical protein